ncbi:MAG: rhodoquinone biosynthesis methyltransferase RquA [Azoarcus sp.]|jgi:SAM-dependent methyltransferase|nr:rhodoquinone biosynthesis methyltransferase RquA [Azoarcus sp.]MDD2873038.1 rhodoquinone biosynthesis methyltransferase RquA [Azoarcus sp.]MDX9837937.1 rhodoquinone biosynthesis methyltransferase RquA [Azoarcus sp.]
MSPPAGESTANAVVLPDYLRKTYTWAYLSHRTLPWLDRSLVVSAILWGNAGRLMRAAVAEFAPGQRVLQAACVYGAFSSMLAARVGESGALEVVDVAPIQIANVRRKLAHQRQAVARLADLSQPLGGATFDGVCCFFLLHEVPEDQRRRIVDNLLAAVEPGGKAVFVDYHRCTRWNPLAPVMNLVFRTLEPYAPSLLDTPIESMSARAGEFDWTHRTLFGGLYQHVVAVRRKA